MKNKKLFILMLFIVFCTERLQKIFNIGFFDLYPARVLFILLVPFFDYNLFVKKSSKEVKFLFKIVIAYIFVVLISALNSNDIVYSLKKWLDTFTLYLFIFIVYSFLLKNFRNVNSEKTMSFFLKYFKIIVIACFLGALFLMRQIDDGGSLRTFGGITIFRRLSFFSDANFFSTFLIIAFSIIFFSKSKDRMFYVLIILISILLSGSKGGMVSLFLSCLFYFKKNIPIIKSKIVNYIGIGILFFFISGALIYPTKLIDSITTSSFFDLKKGDSTILPRILVWNSGFKQYLNSPFFGIGPGNIVNVSKGSKNPDLLSFVENNGFYGLGDDEIDTLATHSNYLEILFEQGIFAFILYIIFIYKVLKISKDSIAYGDKIFLGFYIAFCCFFLSTILLSYYSFYVSFLFGFFFFLHDKKKYEMIVYQSIQKQ